MSKTILLSITLPIYIYIYDGCQKVLLPRPAHIITFRVLFRTASGTFRNCGFLMGPFLVPVSSNQDHTFFVISGYVSGYVSVGASAHPYSTILEGLKNHTENPSEPTDLIKSWAWAALVGAKSGFSKTFQVGPETVKNEEL